MRRYKKGKEDKDEGKTTDKKEEKLNEDFEGQNEDNKELTSFDQ